ncbi:MAG: hypothetical protein EOP48_19595 [Sphingobacteriales bacterium]|nr:MAG: hypothetical protein EOP48_19595 [Sphingobacteriales bacterium]
MNSQVSRINSFNALEIEKLLGSPILRENVWRINPDSSMSYLETLSGVFQVNTDIALDFMKVRTHCTPHNSLETIIERSGVGRERVVAYLFSLIEPGVLLGKKIGNEKLTAKEVASRLEGIATLWGNELNNLMIVNQVSDEKLTKTVLIGWLLEMYHYIADFPKAISFAARLAEGELAELLSKYSDQETGHEEFIVQALEGMGLTRSEIISSRPLASTKAVMLMLRDIFSVHPSAVLVVAHMVEASDIPREDLFRLQREIEERYGLTEGILEPVFEHQAIDAFLGHQKLLTTNRHLLPSASLEKLNDLVSKLHDLKHMFELQTKEIKDYYSNLDGKYFPAQPIRFLTL